MILPQRTLPDRVRQGPVRGGKTAPTSLDEVDVVPREGSRPSGFAAKTKNPRSASGGAGIFSRLESQPKSPAVRRRPLRAMDCQHRKLERLCRRRGVALELGRNFSLRWPLHRGPLDRRGSRRGSHRRGRKRSRWSGGCRRAGTRPRCHLARLRNAPGRRSGGSLTSRRDRGRRRQRGRFGPFGASGKPTDGQGRCGHRTPQTTHVHQTRSSRTSIRRIGHGMRLKPGRAATHTCRRCGPTAGPAEGPAVTREHPGTKASVD